MTPLHWVASYGLLEEAQLLISRGAMADTQVGCMARPIVFAMQNKHYAMVQYLIEAGADKNYALLNAMQRNEIGIAQKLVARGANLLAQNEAGVTLLHFAAMAGATKSAEWLLRQGLDINARDRIGETPLHCAVAEGNLATVKTLVGCGADLETRNKKGQTPLDMAKADFIPRSIARFLRQRGAS